MGNIRQRIQEGGPGSGNFGHAGRPGQQGGSSPGEVSHSGKQSAKDTARPSNIRPGNKPGSWRLRAVDASPREKQLSLFSKPPKKKQTGSTGYNISRRVTGQKSGFFPGVDYSLVKKAGATKTEKGLKRVNNAIAWMQKKARHFDYVGMTSHGQSSSIAKSMGRHYRMKGSK